MPGYEIEAADEGSGLLPWSWAQARLIASRNYWLATVRPDGRPHAMPVWVIWHDGMLWFRTSKPSRKARNLASNPRCMVTTEDALNPVVVEGAARLVTEPDDLATMLELENEKYETEPLIP